MPDATLHDERMPPFDCDCGSARCRGRIRGEDHLSEEVQAYGERLSGHVKRRRARARP